MKFLIILLSLGLVFPLIGTEVCPNSPFKGKSMNEIKYWNKCKGIYLNTINGNKYSGEFKKGKPNGIGSFHSKSGIKYKGHWKNGKFYGKGELVWPDGSQYKGDWKNGMRDGKGAFDAASGISYKGKWKNDLFDGQGIMNYSDGASYTGEWIKGLRNGKGTHTWSNGTVYKGEFKNNKYSGKGAMIFPDGENYIGDWENGLRNGSGSNFWPDGRSYKGGFLNDKKNGQGKFKFSNGDIYEGEWKNDLYEGHGAYKWADGRKFIGLFKNGNKNGKGVEYSSSGEQYNGSWNNDKLNDKLTFNILRIYSDSKNNCNLVFDISNTTSLTINSIKYKIALRNKNNELIDTQIGIVKKLRSQDTVFSKISFENKSKLLEICANIEKINFLGFSDLITSTKINDFKFINKIISTAILTEASFEKKCADYEKNEIAYACYKNMPSTNDLEIQRKIKFQK